jgi:hypothetical protein
MFRVLKIMMGCITILSMQAQTHPLTSDTLTYNNNNYSKRWIQPEFKILKTLIKINYTKLPLVVLKKLKQMPYIVCDSSHFINIINNDADAFLKWCDQHGYLTSELHLEYEMITDTLQISWHMQLRHQYVLDSIICISQHAFRKSFLKGCLRLNTAVPLNYYDITKISSQLSATDFILETKPSQLYLTSNHAKLYLYPELKPASQFEGVLGIQNQTLTQYPVITGDLNLLLKHQLWHHGELIDIKWRRLQFQTQDFQLRFQFPFWMGTPIGSRIDFQIYRRDTSFIDIKQKWGLQYQPTTTRSYDVFYTKHQTTPLSLFSSDTIGQFIREAFGISTFWKFHSKPFPYINGISCDFTFQTGNRYSKAFKNTPQFLTEFKFCYIIPLSHHHAIMYQLNSSALISSRAYFANEMFRIGGFKILRGFDEESLWCSSYAVNTIEYRWMLSSASFLYTFYDQAAYQRQLLTSYLRDFPYSVGMGMQFKLNSGSINLCYAVGSQFNAPLVFSIAKIHVGYKTVF